MVSILKKLIPVHSHVITYDESVFHLDMHLDTRNCVLAEISEGKCEKTRLQL